jgi:hypothetical protein
MVSPLEAALIADEIVLYIAPLPGVLSTVWIFAKLIVGRKMIKKIALRIKLFFYKLKHEAVLR